MVQGVDGKRGDLLLMFRPSVSGVSFLLDLDVLFVRQASSEEYPVHLSIHPGAETRRQLACNN